MNILYATAIQDSFTGVIPAGGSNLWGFGKVNAYRAMVHVLGIVGIEHDVDSPLALLLYPNPNNGQYTIDYTGGKNETLLITVTDLAGKQLLSEKWNVNEGNNKRSLNLTNQPAGIYLTNISGSQGSTVVKIVKQ